MENFKCWTKRVVNDKLDITADWETSNSSYTMTVNERNPIQKALMVKMLLMMEEFKGLENLKREIEQYDEEMKLYSRKISELESKYNLSALRQIGFTSASYSDKDNREEEKYRKKIRFALEEKIRYEELYCYTMGRITLVGEMKKYWGDESILVPYDDFEKVCKRYNLTCGTFSEYTGYVPNDKIESIKMIQKKLEGAGAYWWTKIKTIKRIVEVDLHKYFIDDSEDIVCKERMQSIFPFYSGDKGRWLSQVRFGESCKLFICAPKKYMKDAPIPIVNYTDPFICAYTDYGIMILEKWDLESDDEVIVAHQQKQTSFVNKVKSFIKRLSV